MSQVTIVLFVISLFWCEAKNMLVDFEQAHDYKQWCMVLLQMARQSWFMGMERTHMNKVLRVSFKYRWGTFCTDNYLNVGGTYFFSMIRKTTCSNDDEEEREEEQEDDEAKLKVEVRKTNGGWRQ